MYNVGDQIVTRKKFYKNHETVIVGKIIYKTDWRDEELYYFTETCGSILSNNNSRKDHNHYIPINDDNIEGLYEGYLVCDNITWHPKYSIGDAVLAKLNYFTEYPTWHTILGLQLSCAENDVSSGYLISGLSLEHGIILFEHEILDVIRYGETK